MSGLAFQTLRGPGSQFQNLIDAANRSDLYKTAKEFTFGASLQPIAKSWEIPINENPVNDLSLDGIYFGKWILNHNSQDIGDSNNSRKRSQAFLKYGSDVVARTMIIVHGDDILAWGTETTEHYGFATSLHVHKLEVDDQPQHGVQVSFIGYKLSNNPGFTFPTPVLENNKYSDGNVHLSAQDLTALGYTYQWNVFGGTGTFTNPNEPNTVFVPDGNGQYVLGLLVSDGTNESSPIEIPVTVDNDSTILLNNTGTVPLRLKSGLVVAPLGSVTLKGKVGSDYHFDQLDIPYDHVTELEVVDGDPTYFNSDSPLGVKQHFTFFEHQYVLNSDTHPFGQNFQNIINNLSVFATVQIQTYSENIAPGGTFAILYARDIVIKSSVKFNIVTQETPDVVRNTAEYINGFWQVAFNTQDYYIPTIEPFV